MRKIENKCVVCGKNSGELLLCSDECLRKKMRELADDFDRIAGIVKAQHA